MHAPAPSAVSVPVTTAEAVQHDLPPERPYTRRELAALSLGALGVVYGDIGTSPLYTIRECVNPPHGAPASLENVLGVVSMVLWTLVLIVAIKYLVFILRADNHGEGGILALYALVASSTRTAGRTVAAMLLLGLFGAGLLYGDGVITPVVSILGALEGLGVRAPAFERVIVPVTIAILVGLFVVQRHGTGAIGKYFGRVMLVWFLGIAVAGARGILLRPGIVRALDPRWGLRFFEHHGLHGFPILGAVFLCATGSEALYADMGHFGRRAIRISWFSIVFPALALNYLGQGAIVLADPSAVENPFYALSPGWTLYPMLALAIVAAVIASQALISGVFSLTRSAMQLGYWPRLRVLHTSSREEGQIYIPEMNYLLLVGCIAMTLGFKTSSAIASAYGIAVTGTMIITSLLFWLAARNVLGWSVWRVTLLVAAFLSLEIPFFIANATKIGTGGWWPLVIGAAVFAIMTSWRRGRAILGQRVEEASIPLGDFLADLGRSSTIRVSGTAIFMTQSADVTPVVLLHYFKHSKVLHREVVLFTVHNQRRPKVPLREAVAVKELGSGFWQVVAHVGFMDDPNVPALLLHAQRTAGLAVDLKDASYFLGRETLILGRRAPLATWRKALFAFLSRNARPATQFFNLPPNRVIELGTQVEL